MIMKPQIKTLLSLTCLSLAIAGNVARAETIPIVTGQNWVSSTDGEKKAYLVGISNLLEVERAYPTYNARNDGVAQRFEKGLHGETLDSVRQSLDQYYAANPTMLQHPVIETIWFQVVKPNLDKGQ